MTPYAIVCAGGGPRASAGLRARFPGVPLRYVGPAASAPFGVAADPSLALALRAVDAEVTIVVDPSGTIFGIPDRRRKTSRASGD